MPGWFLQRSSLLFLLLGLRSSAASNLLTGLLLDRSPSGIERRIHIRTRFGIRVGDGDVPELCTSNLVRRLSFLPIRIIEVKIGIGVAMRNPVDSDGTYVGLMIEPMLT